MRRAALGVVSLGLLGGGLVAAPAQAAPADNTAGWLARQLGPSDLVVSEWTDGSTWNSYTDHGLSLDVFFALDAVGVRPKVRTAIIEAMEKQVSEYVSPFGDTYAGSVGKLLTAVQTHGTDAASYADGDLQSRLESLVVLEGEESGRAKDDYDPTPAWASDTSNTIGQSWVVRALAHAGSDLAEDTIDFLLKQQCSEGYFRVYMEGEDHTCDGGKASGVSGASVDATGFALQALHAASEAGLPALADEIDRAVAWLRGQQRPNGAFSEDGLVNSNSTGLAAVALASSGHAGPAGNAARWLNSVRVKPKQAKKKLKGEAGAIAFDKKTFKAAVAGGVQREARYTWRRAAAQAAPGLLALLPKTKVEVKAPRRAATGSDVRVRAFGLEPGERVVVRRGAKKVHQGVVPASGVLRVPVAMPKRAKNVKVTVVGARGNRTGTDTVRVR